MVSGKSFQFPVADSTQPGTGVRVNRKRETRNRQLLSRRPMATIMPVMPELRFGTASFAYEGWKGLVYHDHYSASRFKVDCLREYARFQPFRTVEFDFPFYRPPDDRQLARYAAALPPGFPVLSKVWEELTMPRFPDLPRHGERAGRENPRYLDPGAFREEVLPPYERSFAGHTAPFILEFGADRQPSAERRRDF